MYEVLKFGGSSLTKDGINNILKIINIHKKNKKDLKLVIVLSAIQNTTNLLYQCLNNYHFNTFNKIKLIHYNIINDLGIRNSDMFFKNINNLEQKIINYHENNNINIKNELIAWGELLSTQILHQYLIENNINNILLDSREIICYDKKDSKLNLTCNHNKFLNLSKDNNLIILQGFITKDKDNYTQLLTRGGSDTTATLISNMLKCSDVYIYTDVNGIYVTDPNKIKNTNVIKNLNYTTAQELAAMGAKVLHPYSIKPAEKSNTNIHIKNTYNYENSGTLISNKDNTNYVITNLKEITLFHIKSLNMWNNYGFVYDIFREFSNNNIDINIITTSQFVISCTTDEKDKEKLNKVFIDLSTRYEMTMISQCHMLSVIGNNINHISDKLFNLTKDYNIHITHISSNKLSVSFIIDNKIEHILHEKMFNLINIKNKWWENKSDFFNKLLLNSEENSQYFYSIQNVRENCLNLKNNLLFVDKFFYAMKANCNCEILNEITNKSNNFGLECVSINEIKLAYEFITNKKDILFTPNFCKLNEYKYAFDIGCTVIIDNYEILHNDLFKNKSIGLRLDPIYGDGHHKKVITAGEDCKFGIDVSDIYKVFNICKQNNIKVIGLHCHKGSGINKPNIWIDNAKFLLSYISLFTDVEWINLGGGLGLDLNLPELNKIFTQENINTNIKIYLEPGRYVVATSGVLVSEVTQIKTKNNTTYVGIDTGMNSLIRPALYNSIHPIHILNKKNLNNIKSKYTIVGPICESGDVFAKDIILPKVKVGDLLLIENCGAYGFTMSSNYNLRNPAKEKTI